jgi:HD-GYP domain-containing protein (c-di-GMP phosphodiesterase class II)
MELKTKDLIAIPIAEFLVGNKIPVNLYVRLNDDKFVLIAKPGQATNKDQLKSYNSKEIQYLWVKREEYSKLAQTAITIAGIVITKKDLDVRQKSTVLSAAAQTVFTQFEHMGMSIELYNNAKLVTEAMVSMCDSHKDLSQLFASLKTYSDQLLGHSMAVSATSVLIGSAMGWEKKNTLEKLSLGGLLHDIGKKTLPPDLLKKSIAQMNSEEIAYWETHPYRGMQLVLSLGIVPDDIVSIIYEHHENSLGQGFPQRIRDVKIHPLAKVVGLADQFVNLTIANPNCPVPKNSREAVMYIEHTMGQPFNRDVFRALKKVVEKDGTGAATNAA